MPQRGPSNWGNLLRWKYGFESPQTKERTDPGLHLECLNPSGCYAKGGPLESTFFCAQVTKSGEGRVDHKSLLFINMQRDAKFPTSVKTGMKTGFARNTKA